MTATKFSFRMADGKYPVTARGKLQWLSDRDKAIEMGQSVGAAELVEMDDKGKVLATSPLPNNSLTGREPATGEAYRAGVGSALIHPSERKP